VFYGLLISSISCIVLCSVWLVLLSIYLIGTGGTYSRSFPDGTLACGRPIFTRDAWFWTGFQLFGVPLILMIASCRTIAYCRRRSCFIPKVCDNLVTTPQRNWS